MEINPGDKKIIDLLSQLKNSNGAYPSDIYAARRQNYLKQVANVGLGIGVGAGLNHIAKSGHHVGKVATVTSKILEITLVAAIAIEAGTVAYLYRGKIADMLKTYVGSSNVQEVTPQPEKNLTSVPKLLNPIVTMSITPSATPSGLPTSTSSSEVTVENNSNNENPNVNSTPNPGGNNGNHYGNTPKPERTKENSNNNDGGDNNGNGKKDK